jgi:hypothetical protein
MFCFVLSVSGRTRRTHSIHSTTRDCSRTRSIPGTDITSKSSGQRRSTGRAFTTALGKRLSASTKQSSESDSDVRLCWTLSDYVGLCPTMLDLTNFGGQFRRSLTDFAFNLSAMQFFKVAISHELFPFRKNIITM